MRVHLNSYFLVILAAATLAGCSSEPVKEIKGMFQRATEASGPGDSEAKPETKAEKVPQPQSSYNSPQAAVPAKTEPKGAPELVAGIKAYDDGQYPQSAKILRTALPRLNKADQVQAYKYLAFIECSLGRKTRCRGEFAKALKIDPSFDLEPSEAGHPLWGPVFRAAKQKAQQPQQTAGVKKRAK
ncbi:MAG: TssQ family T6SS-associated lipoprotein [Burkholderiales bacterium]